MNGCQTLMELLAQLKILRHQTLAMVLTQSLLELKIRMIFGVILRTLLLQYIWFVGIDSPDDNSVHTRGDDLALVGYVSDDDTDGMTYLWESDVDGILGSIQSLNVTGLTNGTHTITF